MPVIVVTSREDVKTFVLEEGKPLFLGRGTDCDVVLPSAAVSRRHAVILYKNGICGVKDLGSFNGTILNGEVIQEPHHLRDDDTLRISSYIIKLHTKDRELAVQEGTDGIDQSSATSKRRSLRIDSRKFENSGLPLPRAMQQSKAIEKSMQGFKPITPEPRDTAAFSPSKNTLEFIKSKEDSLGESASNPLPMQPGQEGDEEAAYFTPFPIPDAGKDSGSERRSSETAIIVKSDIADFEESPLAPLEDISQFGEEAGPTPFLASAENFEAVSEFVASQSSQAESVIPLESDYHTEIANLSSEAEAIIPLMDDTPLIATLKQDNSEDDSECETDDQDYESVQIQPVQDTAMYTLPPGIYEPDGLPDTGNYQVAQTQQEEPPKLNPTSTGSISPVTSSSESGRTTVEDDEPDSFGDEFGVQPTPPTESYRVVANVGQVGSSKSSLKGKSSLAGIASITISSDLMAAINTRFSLYSLLYDLVEERRRFRKKNPTLPEEVEEELNRQDRELDNLPTAEEADRQLQDLNERNEQLNLAITQAAEAGVPGPPKPTDAMLFAEELAVTQWMLISDSNRQALPPIYREAYSLTTDELFVKELSAAKISHGRLMGGAVYLLALESLATLANKERFRIAKKTRALSEPEEENDGFFSKLGAISKKAEHFMNRNQIREQIAHLENEDRVNEIRAELANRESTFMEKTLAREFRQVYKKVALKYIPSYDTMPPCIRAFIRHGAIGYSPWWMTKEVREYIIRDCRDNILPEFSHGTGDINVLYADEYLYAVSQMDCSPSPDEELMASSLNSNEWKTDRAYRRIVNARTYDVLMEEMINQLELTGRYINNEADNLEKRIEAIKARGYAGPDNTFELQTELQQFRSRQENINRNIGRIKEELIPSILEAIEDAERRFRTGDLRVPDQETLIRREVDALFRISRQLEGDRERFVPMIVREQYRYKADTINDRAAVRSTLVKMEELDPNIFMRTIIPAKNKRNRVNLRMTPTVLIFPSAGRKCLCSMGREGMESGHLVVPACFVKRNLRSKRITHLLADFRWETSRVEAGRELAKSETLAGAFTRIRRAAAQTHKEVREKQLLFTDVGEKENWRFVYEVYLPDALNGGRLLFQRNPALYEAIIGKYIDPPEGVKILRRG